MVAKVRNKTNLLSEFLKSFFFNWFSILRQPRFAGYRQLTCFVCIRAKTKKRRWNVVTVILLQFFILLELLMLLVRIFSYGYDPHNYYQKVGPFLDGVLENLPVFKWSIFALSLLILTFRQDWDSEDG